MTEAWEQEQNDDSAIDADAQADDLLRPTEERMREVVGRLRQPDWWMSDTLHEDTITLLEALSAENKALREALEEIAAFRDTGAGGHLKATGSYACFDEPGSVEIARAALQAGDCDECDGLRKDPDNGMPCPVCCSSDDLEAWNPHAGENDD